MDANETKQTPETSEESPRNVQGKSMYTYIAEAWNTPSESYVKQLQWSRLIEWRKEENYLKIDRPTRLDRARKLGYKAKQGYIIVRGRVRKGSLRKRQKRTQSQTPRY